MLDYADALLVNQTGSRVTPDLTPFVLHRTQLSNWVSVTSPTIASSRAGGEGQTETGVHGACYLGGDGFVLEQGKACDGKTRARAH